ncbi:unnamed protein product [Mytilus coruscus]|uniref:Uncharacterized protein n=1 Tax=Mytilus coruscus TaxID=42192 RepID=A0A6J8EBU5_MYTCO|nr:unnamed protein product [Mytilus coruscus]
MELETLAGRYFGPFSARKGREAMAVQCKEDQLRDFYQCMTEGSNARQKGRRRCLPVCCLHPAKIQKTFRFSNNVKEELCSRVVKRNSYTIKMVDNTIVEVGHYLIHKSSRKVVAVCQKFQPLGLLIRNRLQHLQTFQLQSVENTVVRAELLQEPVVVKTESKICCGVIPNNVERD